jgi:hypothetical protein
MSATAQMASNLCVHYADRWGKKQMNAQMIGRIARSVWEAWGSLDELREVAGRQGFTQDQFGHAIDTVGSNPHHVANELQRHLFMAALYVGQAEPA